MRMTPFIKIGKYFYCSFSLEKYMSLYHPIDMDDEFVSVTEMGGEWFGIKESMVIEESAYGTYYIMRYLPGVKRRYVKETAKSLDEAKSWVIELLNGAGHTMLTDEEFARVSNLF